MIADEHTSTVDVPPRIHSRLRTPRSAHVLESVSAQHGAAVDYDLGAIRESRLVACVRLRVALSRVAPLEEGDEVRWRRVPTVSPVARRR